jgi:hypothetical protein
VAARAQRTDRQAGGAPGRGEGGAGAGGAAAGGAGDLSG